MNNDNEMKEFNSNFGTSHDVPVEPYRVTQNNVTFNDVNNNTIQDNNSSVIMPDYNTQTTEQLIPEYNSDPVTDVNSTLYNTTDYINDKPVEKKTKKTTIKINPELKTAIVIALILLVAMSFIPTIFDFLNDLKLKIFG